MSTGSWIELGGRAAAFIIETIAKYVDGDNSEPVKRVIDVLPISMRSDVEHARQKELLRKELEEKFGTP